MTLFRQQALAQKHKQIWGEVVISRSVKNNTIFLLFSLLFACAIVFLFIGQYSQKETVMGLLEPASGVIEARSPKSGILHSVFVQEGEYVHKGTPLFKINSETFLTSGISNNQIRLAQLNRRRDILVDLKKAKHIEIAQNKDALSHRLNVIDSQQALLTEESQILDQELALAAQERSQQLALGKHSLTSKSLQNRAEEKWLAVKRKVADNKIKSLNLLSNLSNLKDSHRIQTTNLENYLKELDIKLISLDHDITSLRSNHTTVVTAPADGLVSSLSLEVGMPINTNEYLVSIIPEHQPLVAKLFIPTRAIGFIENGKPVIIKLDAFPYQKYGPVKGSISSISKNIMHGQRSHNVLSFSEPVYKSLAQLDNQFITINGKPIDLQAGMIFSADIVVSQRTIAEWLFAPILGALG